MNKNLTFYCIFSFLLGIIIYCCQFLNIKLPKIINNYGNDFLIIPIVLFFCLIVIQWLRKDPLFVLKIPIILYVCFMYSVLFEYIFPMYLNRYTADILDVFLYFLGGFVFYFLQNKHQKKY